MSPNLFWVPSSTCLVSVRDRIELSACSIALWCGTPTILGTNTRVGRTITNTRNINYYFSFITLRSRCCRRNYQKEEERKKQSNEQASRVRTRRKGEAQIPSRNGILVIIIVIGNNIIISSKHQLTPPHPCHHSCRIRQYYTHR